MDIVVNDTNIFIDLYSVGLIDAFFNLPFEVHTVDFVVNEIEDEQQSLLVNQLIDNGRLTVIPLLQKSCLRYWSFKQMQEATSR